MAHLSDGLFTTSIAIYALAMVGFVTEYSFGRRGRIADTLPAPAPARELVGAGGPGVVDDIAVASEAADATGPADGEGRRSFADRAGRYAFALTVLGVLVHAASI